jgi:hypothetical protein
MRIATALLCDSAGVREGLLFVLGGGVSRVWRQTLPAPLNCCLAVLVEVDAAQLAVPHELRADLIGPQGQNLAQVRGGFQVGPSPIADPGEGLLVPVALDLRNVAIKDFGWHRFVMSLDDEAAPEIPFKVALPPQAGRPQGTGTGRQN